MAPTRGAKKKTATQTEPDQNVESVIELEAKAIQQRSFAERLADRTTQAAGSSLCIVLHAIWFAVWIGVNEGLGGHIKQFDPFPFSLLTLIVSLEAIFLTQLVLITQNRMTHEADKRAHLDLQVNMLAEQEGTMTVRMLCRICEHLGLEVDDPHILEKLKKSTSVGKIADKLDEQLPK